MNQKSFAAAFLVLLLGLPGLALGQDEVPRIYRPGTEAPSGALRILRPEVALAEAVVPAPLPAPAAPMVAAGDDLWIYDRPNGRLTVCRLIDTLYVGRHKIACFGRRLAAR